MKSFKNYSEINEALKAEDYEAAIVMGFYQITEREMGSPESHGISKKVFDLINSNPAAMQTGINIAKKVLQEFPSLKNENAEQYGRAKTSVTSYWASFGASNPTPKTDVLIGSKRFSVKVGIAQLMSGGKDESTATFNAAVKNSDPSLVKSSQFKKTSGVLEGFVKSTLAPSQLRPLIKSGKNSVVNAGEKAHKDAMKELGKLFSESEDFKIEFAREAMSGFEKFGKSSNAAAEYMLVSNATGSQVEIHSVYDNSYCSKIANAMKLQARFKTSSRKIKGKKTGEYNFWSVISLIVDSMPQGDLVTEEAEELNELKIFKKIKNKLNKMFVKVKKFFHSSTSRLISFLSAEPDIKVKTKIKF